MMEPPVMVSTKDSMYLCDILNVLHTLIKKFKHYDNEIQDQALSQLVTESTNELVNQYTSLLEVFNSGQ